MVIKNKHTKPNIIAVFYSKVMLCDIILVFYLQIQKKMTSKSILQSKTLYKIKMLRSGIAISYF